MTIPPLTQEQKRLVEDNMPLATIVAARIYHPHLEFEDAFQEACIGLMKAARLYDPEKGSFSTIASIACRHSIQIKERRYKNTPSNSCSLDQEDVILAKLISDPESCHFSEHGEDLFLLIKQFSDTLTSRDKYLLTHCILSTDMTQQEIADELNASQSCVSRRAKSLRTKLQKHINERWINDETV